MRAGRVVPARHGLLRVRTFNTVNLPGERANFRCPALHKKSPGAMAGAWESSDGRGASPLVVRITDCGRAGSRAKKTPAEAKAEVESWKTRRSACLRAESTSQRRPMVADEAAEVPVPHKRALAVVAGLDGEARHGWDVVGHLLSLSKPPQGLSPTLKSGSLSAYRPMQDHEVADTDHQASSEI